MQGRGRRVPARAIRAGLAVWLCVGMAAVSMAGPVTLTVTGSVDFPDESPDLAPVLGPEDIQVEVRALAVPGSPWILTIIADSDLMSGTSAIPIGEITWTASPSPPFQAGTLSTVVPSVLGSGLSHFTALLTLSFYLRNSWSYEPGHYAATATLTLSSP